MFVSLSLFQFQMITLPSILSWKFFFFSTLNILCHFLLACKISAEQSAGSLMGVLLYITCFSTVATFKVLSLFLCFAISIVMYLGVDLFGFLFFGTVCASWAWICFLLKLRKYLVIIFQMNVLPFPLSLLSVMRMLCFLIFS